MIQLMPMCQAAPGFRLCSRHRQLTLSKIDFGVVVRWFSRRPTTVYQPGSVSGGPCGSRPNLNRSTCWSIGESKGSPRTPIYVLRQLSARNVVGIPSSLGGKALGVKPLSAAGEIRKLLGLAKDEKWRLAGAVCLLVVSSAVTMAVPFCMGKIIDTIYTSDTEAMKAKLTLVGQILFVVFIIGAAANFGRVYLMQTTGYKITQKLRTQVFSSIMKQEMSFFDNNKTGELINRLSSDSALVANSLSLNISDGLRSFIAISAGVSMMFYTSAELALVGLATVPPVFVLAIVYGRYVRKITIRVQDALAGTTQLAEERISNVRTVRAFAQEGRECRSYAEQTTNVLHLMYKESLARGLFFGMTGLSGNVVVLSVLCYGGLMVTQSEITVGNLSAFLLYAAYVGISFGGLSSAYSATMKGLGASTRLWEIIDRVPDIPATGNIIPFERLVGNIEFRGVSFHYPSRPDAHIFKDLDLAIPAGSITAVVGSSGSGKSTLAHLILRFYDPISGNILLDGNKMNTLDPNWIRTVIGTVTQEPILFSCSIKDNILYGSTDPARVDHDQLVAVCRESNAYEFIAGFPDQFDTVVGERGIMLSGGQRQRIAIARALLKNPKILLLDEATSALDAESEFLVKEALERLMIGRTVMTIAHRLSTIANAHQIAVLSDGRIAELGSYDMLMALPNGMFRKLVERQTIVADR